MTIAIIDPNLRVAFNETVTSLDFIEGPIFKGMEVLVLEKESNTRGTGIVTKIDYENWFAYISVDWRNFGIADHIEMHSPFLKTTTGNTNLELVS